ncbi:hypothetical protein D4S03_05730 [bacterium]|nr:MAG: hypothetical protein D4S03_05730 [bacterium]
MATVIVVMIVFALLVFVGFSFLFDVDLVEGWMGPILVVGCVIGILMAIGIGDKVPYVQTTTPQPMVSIYTNQSGSEIYLKAITGSQLLYRVMDNGVPRERTISAGNVKSVVMEDVSPYVETTKFLFKEKWDKYFAFSSKNDVVVFHVPQKGIEADINSFLK